ncbi:MAG: DNA-binding protein [Gammaproteobacteria bacterium]|nr:DNA-binding protein [Gammaproteobacteria bacterium]
MNYDGTLESLQSIVAACGYSITDTRPNGAGHQIRTAEKAIINWYPTTGTVQIQGKADIVAKFHDDWGAYTGSKQDPAVEPTQGIQEPDAPTLEVGTSKKVFVVHGHDVTAREQLELIIHKLGLNPFVLANTGGGGLTIIEALEKEIGSSTTQARFGIVLMTPDDVGYAKAAGPDAAQDRARQNVVLEMGMLISAVGRGNVAILQKGHVEIPSDAQGILYLHFNDHVKEVVPKLTDRLRAAGFVLNPDAITSASS